MSTGYPTLSCNLGSVCLLIRDSSHGSSVLSKQLCLSPSLVDGLRNGLVEEFAEEVEPLGFLNLAITIGIECREEVPNLGVVGASHHSTFH